MGGRFDSSAEPISSNQGNWRKEYRTEKRICVTTKAGAYYSLHKSNVLYFIMYVIYIHNFKRIDLKSPTGG